MRQAPAERADQRQPAQLGRHRLGPLRRRSTRSPPRCPSVLARPAYDERDEDHHGEHDVREARVARVVPSHALLEDTEGHRRQGDGRKVVEPTEHQRGERHHERREASAEASETPTAPARRNTPRNDSPAAITQTSVCTRFTGMPSMLARSPLSALARTAMPTSVRRRNRASADHHHRRDDQGQHLVAPEDLRPERELQLSRAR